MDLSVSKNSQPSIKSGSKTNLERRVEADKTQAEKDGQTYIQRERERERDR
jgi:hypothetical protein